MATPWFDRLYSWIVSKQIFSFKEKEDEIILLMLNHSEAVVRQEESSISDLATQPLQIRPL